MPLCSSSCASLSSRYADADPNSSVALIHVHYVAWQYLPGSPSSAAPIDLHNLAWHHLVLTCYLHHCPPKRPNKAFISKAAAMIDLHDPAWHHL